MKGSKDKMNKTYFELMRENQELKAKLHNLNKENAMLKTQVKDFDVHDIVESQIDKSTIPRLNWKALLGESLTKYVAERYAKNYEPEKTYAELEQKLRSMQIDNAEIFRRLKIGVSSRYAEIMSESKKIKEVQNEKFSGQKAL